MSEPQKQTDKPALTRIALERVWFKEVQDFPGGNGVAPSVIVEPQKHPGRQFFKAFFVPSFQIVEVEWYQDEKTDAQVFPIPMTGVLRMKYPPRSKG